MTISYKKLWIMLAENKMSKAELAVPCYLHQVTPQSVRFYGDATENRGSYGL